MADAHTSPSGASASKGSAATTVYKIKDAAGEVVAEHVRTDYPDKPKDVKWRQPNGAWGLNGTRSEDLPLYGSELLDEWPKDRPVALVEGEPAANALNETGVFRALGTVTGAGGTPSAEVLEVLRGYEVILWPDADDPGRKHMERTAERLAGVAGAVRVYDWPEAKEKGDDAADHPAILAGSEKALGILLNDLMGAPEWQPPEPDLDGFIDSPHIGGGFGENKPLPIKTVEEILAESGEEVDWVVENVLARGALTEFSGLAKKGGKTTFWCYAIAAGARGEEHAGFTTQPAKYLYLTEQGNNFAQPLRESGLTEHPDHVLVVQFKDVSGLQWSTLIQKAGAEAKQRKLDVLAVDTFAVFAGLRGSEENDSGPVADRMRVLRLVAQKYNIAVLLIRHAGKDGTPRGSSAFEAEADICVTLSRPEGRHAPSVRKISGIGRYGEWERNIQLQDGRYISLGADDKVEFNRAVKFIKAVLPSAPDGGLKKQDILNQRSGDDEHITASTLDRALAWLVKQGEVGQKQLVDQRGKPKVYWLAYKPPGGGSIDSPQTPPLKGENKSETLASSSSPDLAEDYDAMVADRMAGLEAELNGSGKVRL